MNIRRPATPGTLHPYTVTLRAVEKIDAYTGALFKRIKKAQICGTGLLWKARCFGADVKAAWIKRLDDMGIGSNVQVTKEGPGVAIVVLELGVDTVAKLNVPNVNVSTVATYPMGQQPN